MQDATTEYPLVTLTAPARISVALTPKREAFAQHYAAHGNATDAFRAAFDCSRMKRRSINELAYRTAHEPAVAERVRQLLAQAAEGTTISARARMARLQDIVDADPGEVARVVTEPCNACWSDVLALAAAIDRAGAGNGDMPDTSAPREDCTSCRGHGVQRLVVTDTDRLTGSARKLIKAVRQKSDGSIEVVMHDQIAANDMLNRLQGCYIERSESRNLNINATVAAPDVSVDAVLAAFHRGRERTDG